MRHLIAFTIITLLTTPLFAQATQSMDDFTLSPLRITQLQPATYLYASAKTTYTNHETAGKMMADVTRALAIGQITPTGAPVVVCHGATSDPKVPFIMDVGFPVPDSTLSQPHCKIGRLPSIRCATSLFTGSPADLNLAIHQLYTQLRDQGHTPTDLQRQRYLYWEGADSSNNMVLIEIELKS